MDRRCNTQMTLYTNDSNGSNRANSANGANGAKSWVPGRSPMAKKPGSKGHLAPKKKRPVFRVSPDCVDQ